MKKLFIQVLPIALLASVPGFLSGFVVGAAVNHNEEIGPIQKAERELAIRYRDIKDAECALRAELKKMEAAKHNGTPNQIPGDAIHVEKGTGTH